MDIEGNRRGSRRRRDVIWCDICCFSTDLFSSINPSVCQHSLSVFFVVLETISLVLDVFGQSRWRIRLAAFLLSVIGFLMTICTRVLERTEVHAEMQLVVVEIGFSVVQLIATFMAVLGVKSTNNYTAAVLLLVFSIIAAVFIFRKDRINGPWSREEKSDPGNLMIFANGYELLCEHKQRALAVFFVVLETVSLVLDVFGQSRRRILLAAFLLSVFGFVMTIFTCILERTKVHAEKQLGVVEIGFSVVQLIATFLAFLSVKSTNNYTAAVLLLVFSIIAAVFIFRKDRINGPWSREEESDPWNFYASSYAALPRRQEQILNDDASSCAAVPRQIPWSREEEAVLRRIQVQILNDDASSYEALWSQEDEETALPRRQEQNLNDDANSYAALPRQEDEEAALPRRQEQILNDNASSPAAALVRQTKFSFAELRRATRQFLNDDKFRSYQEQILTDHALRRRIDRSLKIEAAEEKKK